MPYPKVKIGTWIDANRVRVVKNGRKHEIQIEKPAKTNRKRRNVAMGFMNGGVFHPIRASDDYSRRRAGESVRIVGRPTKKRKTKAKTKTKRKAATKRR